MKISKKILIYLAGGILVIIIAGLLVAYSQRDGEQSLLKDDIALAQLRLQKYPAQQLSSQQKDMNNQLAQAELQLIAAKAGLLQGTSESRLGLQDLRKALRYTVDGTSHLIKCFTRVLFVLVEPLVLQDNGILD